MRGRFGAGVAAFAAGAVLMTAGCGQREVSFQPVDGSGESSPAVTATVTATPSGVTTDAASGLVITRNGSLVCVRGPRGGHACTSGSGTIVVDGVTVRNGVVVSGDGAAVSSVTPRPTKGEVRITGAVTWSGTASGTCEGYGTRVRRVVAELPGLGELSVHNVGDGVTKVSLEANGQDYGLNYVGQGGPVSSTDDRTVVEDARLGRSGNTVVLSADFNC